MDKTPELCTCQNHHRSAYGLDPPSSVSGPVQLIRLIGPDSAKSKKTRANQCSMFFNYLRTLSFDSNSSNSNHDSVSATITLLYFEKSNTHMRSFLTHMIMVGLKTNSHTKKQPEKNS